MWEEEREQRQQIKFDFGALSEQELSRLKRTPTPYPKEMKQRVQHMRNLALKQANVPNGEAKGGTGPSLNLPRTNQDYYERVIRVIMQHCVLCLLLIPCYSSNIKSLVLKSQVVKYLLS